MTEAASRLLCLPLLLVMVAASAIAGSGAPVAQAREIALGVYFPDVARHPGKIDRYARLLGRKPMIVSDYKQWDFAPFVEDELDDVWNRGSVPMVTWEPMSYQGRRYTLRGIARGRYDRYVGRAADDAAAWGRPIFLRFAHEMNGDWYPWGSSGANSARVYKRAWRHLVRIFRRNGADNVSWVWTPYVNQGGGLPFKPYYPGDRWVDWVGLDGFNWGYGGSSYTFNELFRGSYRSLARLSSRPMMIAETGTHGGGKARWIAQTLRQLPRLPRLRAFVWFNNQTNGVDLRFNSSRGALRAFRTAARRPRFGLTRQRLLGASGLSRRERPRAPEAGRN
jgi:mannan endo-1,4-beta-mannosidase